MRQFHVGVHASELSNVLCLPDQDAAISFDSREGKAASWCLDSGRLIQSHVLGATQVLERRRGGCPMLACFTSGQRSVLRISDAGALTAKEDEVTEEAAGEGPRPQCWLIAADGGKIWGTGDGDTAQR